LPNGRKLVARRQRPRRQAALHLVNKLPINRNAARLVDAEPEVHISSVLVY
jgi:hypothetical protein